jgi:hypothetical protein
MQVRDLPVITELSWEEYYPSQPKKK